MKAPLQGIRVIDFTRFLAGPFCTMQLGDMGAEVIKVETPGTGDDIRHAPPFLGGESTYFLLNNRNKKSVTLNLKKEEGREIVRRLIAQSDVLVENFRPGVTSRLGIDYPTVRTINPRLIYCSVSGYGQKGRKEPSYDPIVQGEAGLMSVNGSPDGEPVKVAIPIADLASALYATQGILLALFAREKTGTGGWIDISMLESVISLLSLPASVYLGTGENPPRVGNMHPSFAPYQLFETADGFINIAVGSQPLWKAFCQATGLEELLDDPRFADNEKRIQNRPALLKIIQDLLKTKNTREWQKLFTENGVPNGPVRSIKEVFEDENLVAQGSIVILEHKKMGKVSIPGNPVRLSYQEEMLYEPPPLLGEHTEEILSGLGYSKEEITHLAAQGVI